MDRPEELNNKITQKPPSRKELLSTSHTQSIKYKFGFNQLKKPPELGQVAFNKH